jgi:mannosyltransferase OCH1-like enzyme
MIIVIIIIILVLLLLLINININSCKKQEKFSINNNIPKVIYLSYKTKNIPDYIIPNIKKLYPDYEIKLYDDNDCKNFLLLNYGQLYVDIFNFLKDGPIKADFWRICILYKYGGVYFDLDLEHFINLNEIIEDDTDFVTIKTHCKYTCFYKNNFNPAIIISKQNNKILKQCIDRYIEKYNNKDKYEYWDYSIVIIMTKILKNTISMKSNESGTYYDKENNKYQILLEQIPMLINIKNAYIEYNNIKIANARYKKYDSTNHTF